MGAVGHSHLKGMDIASNEDIKGLADAILGFDLKLFGVKAPIRGRTMFMVSAALDQQAKLFSLELDDFPNGGRVKNHRELLPGEVELGIPAGLTSEQGLDLRNEVTQILSDFMQSRSADLNPDNTNGLVGLLVSVGKVLTTLAETTPSISNMFDVAIKSASGLTIQGEINFKKRRIVNLDQLVERRWVYEVDGFAP